MSLEKTHGFTLTNRNELTVHGITEVISFDENSVELQTNLGKMLVTGTGIKVSAMDLAQGLITVSAEQVDSLEYIADGPAASTSLWGRLFSRL